MDKVNVAVFPCGSEVGLEINRALRFSRHFKLFGINSVNDHGRMVFENYMGSLPAFKEPDFIDVLKKTVQRHQIRFLIPTMDEVASFLKVREDELGCEVVCAETETIQLLTSKSQTYSKLKDVLPVPELYTEFNEIKNHLPVFTKPDIGYGSRNVELVVSEKQLNKRWEEREGLLFIENLPGKEYTIDCFSDKESNVLFTGPRLRNRIRMGISVNTIPVELEGIETIAQKISVTLGLKGTWFFQMKENEKGKLTLLEVASRVGGSMALNRLKGVNFVLLDLFQRLDYPVAIHEYNLPNMELERAFNCKLVSDLVFDTVYVDFDDCLLMEDKLNTQLVHFLFQQINAQKN